MPKFRGLAVLLATLASACGFGSDGSGGGGGSSSGTGTVAAESDTGTQSEGADTRGAAEQDAESAADDGDPGAMGCCAAHAAPGCDEAAVAECVCAMDAVCCTFEWDDNCADNARNRCAATCQPDPSVGESGGADTGGPDDGMEGPGDGMEGPDDGNDDGGGSGDCCAPNPDAGCADDAIESCVCNADPFCCQRQWDFQCVLAAHGRCNAMCSLGGTACCEFHMQPGCDAMMVQTCVCQTDPFCCDSAWDDQCVQIADRRCNAMCSR